VSGQRESYGTIDARDLFHYDNVFDIAEARTSQFFREDDAHKTKLTHPRKEFARKVLAFVPIA
jgi:hypothetical protein